MRCRRPVLIRHPLQERSRSSCQDREGKSYLFVYLHSHTCIQRRRYRVYSVQVKWQQAIKMSALTLCNGKILCPMAKSTSYTYHFWMNALAYPCPASNPLASAV